jgi:hypothetical protein
MNMTKFGRTLLFIVFVLMIVFGARLAFKAVDPYTRKVSPSLADALSNI